MILIQPAIVELRSVQDVQIALLLEQKLEDDLVEVAQKKLVLLHFVLHIRMCIQEQEIQIIQMFVE
jgi:hypothetical protein